MDNEGTEKRGTGLGATGAATAAGPGHGEALPEIRPWREVGWIFKDGDALAIERRDARARERSAQTERSAQRAPRRDE